jgi:hypothetical protein
MTPHCEQLRNLCALDSLVTAHVALQHSATDSESLAMIPCTLA